MKSPEQTGELPGQLKEKPTKDGEKTPEKPISHEEMTRQKRRDYGLEDGKELTPAEIKEIDATIEKLLERLYKYDYNDLDSETQDEWYQVDQEAMVGKDRELAKAVLERFLKVLQDLFPINTPFREPLEETEYRIKIKELKSRPDKLVREFSDAASRIKFNSENLNWYIKKFLPQGRKIFMQLRKTYGIKVVTMDYVVGQNEKGKLTLFTIVDRIDGENLEDIKVLPAEAKKELDSTYAALAQYYLDAYTNKSDHWGDPSNKQFVYGHKYGKKENHVYLVDIDPEVNIYNEQKEREFNEDLFYCLKKACEDMLIVEKKFKSALKLSQSRDKFTEVIEKISKEGPESRIKSIIIDELKNLLL